LSRIVVNYVTASARENKRNQNSNVEYGQVFFVIHNNARTYHQNYDNLSFRIP